MKKIIIRKIENSPVVAAALLSTAFPHEEGSRSSNHPKKLKANTANKRKKKIQMPSAARAGIGLLIMGALLVAFGQYLERGALSLYVVIIVACGFVLYMTASIVAKRRAKI